MSETIKTLRADYNSEVKKGEISAELEPSLSDPGRPGQGDVMQLVLQAQRESGG